MCVGWGVPSKSHSTQVSVSIAECLHSSWLEASVSLPQAPLVGLFSTWQLVAEEVMKGREKLAGEGRERKRGREGERQGGRQGLGKAGNCKAHSLIHPNLKSNVSSLLPFSAGHTDQI